MALALITGASSGIGQELARLHAPHGDVLLVARREHRLKGLAAELAGDHEAHVLAMDLAKPGGPAAVQSFCKEQGLEVEVLVNNAGFGAHGRVAEIPLQRQQEMVDLNVRALVEMTHRFLPGMVERGRGRILQVGSTAGFLPGPFKATYYASKAFVNSFSRAVHEELRGTGVTCTVLCPGPVDTEFAAVADVEDTRAFRYGAISAKRTAQAAYKAMMKGKDMVVVPRSLGPLLGRIVPLMPRKAVARASRRAMEKRH